MWQIWQKKINMFVLAYVFFTYQPLMFDLSAARSGITSFHSWNNLQIRNTVPLATIPISEYFYTDGATNVFKWATKTINYSKFVTDIWSNMALRVVNNNALSLKSSASKTFSLCKNFFIDVSPVCKKNLPKNICSSCTIPRSVSK